MCLGRRWKHTSSLRSFLVLNFSTSSGSQHVHFGPNHDVKPTTHAYSPINVNCLRRHVSKRWLKTWLCQKRAGGVAITISKFCIVLFLTSLDQHHLEANRKIQLKFWNYSRVMRVIRLYYLNSSSNLICTTRTRQVIQNSLLDSASTRITW